MYYHPRSGNSRARYLPKINENTYKSTESYKTYVPCTQMFITALFTITPNWKQPKCPLTSEWISKLWQAHTME